MRSLVSSISRRHDASPSITVGLSRITSSLFTTERRLLPNNAPIHGIVLKPGRPLLSRAEDSFIRPPMATMLLSLTRTMVSLSLIELEASGKRKVPESPRSMVLVFSITLDTDGWMCRMIWLFWSICGVTSRATPEKNGATVMVGDWVVPATVVVVLEVTLVTKNSSVPTLSTAFWLLIVAILGLERTCRSPWVSRKEMSAAKFPVWNASPNKEPGAPTPAEITPGAAGLDESRELAVTEPSALSAVNPLIAPLGDSVEPGDSTPPAKRLLGPCVKAAQFTPLWWLSESCTSMIFAHSMTWGSTTIYIALQNSSTPRSSAG